MIKKKSYQVIVPCGVHFSVFHKWKFQNTSVFKYFQFGVVLLVKVVDCQCVRMLFCEFDPLAAQAVFP